MTANIFCQAFTWNVRLIAQILKVNDLFMNYE